MLEPTNRILNQLMTHTSIFFSTSRRLTSRSVISPTAFFFWAPKVLFIDKISVCVRREVPARGSQHPDQIEELQVKNTPLRVDSSTNVDRFILVLTR